MIYEQTTGRLLDGPTLVGSGWAGHGPGKNNHEMQNVKGVGPLPLGKYYIQDPIEGTHLGPIAMPLTPDASNQMFGRSSFFIHGAEAAHPELSSDGCIIQGHASRAYIQAKIKGSPVDSLQRLLEVIVS